MIERLLYKLTHIEINKEFIFLLGRFCIIIIQLNRNQTEYWCILHYVTKMMRRYSTSITYLTEMHYLSLTQSGLQQRVHFTHLLPFLLFILYSTVILYYGAICCNILNQIISITNDNAACDSVYNIKRKIKHLLTSWKWILFPSCHKEWTDGDIVFKIKGWTSSN